MSHPKKNLRGNREPDPSGPEYGKADLDSADTKIHNPVWSWACWEVTHWFQKEEEEDEHTACQ